MTISAFRTLAVLVLLIFLMPVAAVHADTRPDIYGIGLMWNDWFPVNDLPPAYQSDPRSYDQAQMDLIVAAGGNATHGTFDWISIEPTRGTYDWTRADERVADAVARGLEVYAYIGNTPDWAVPAGSSLPGYRTPPDEAYAQDFIDFCTAVASRYAGQVDNFFFWNEPNGCSWVNDGCSNGNGYPLYTHWLKRAYTALKAGNPNCKVGAGVLDYNEGVTQGWTYIQGMYDEGAKGYFDAIVIHPYSSTGVHWNAIHDTRAVMVANGDADKEIWINEYGWANSSDPNAQQYLTDFLTTINQCEYSYVTYCRYLVVSDLPYGAYGLVNHELTPRPIYNTYSSLNKTLLDCTPTPTPTQGPTPTPTPTPLPGVITNAGFETGLNGWTGWEDYPHDGDGDANGVDYPGHMDLEWDHDLHIPLDGFTHEGSHSAGASIGWSSGRGGMYQVISVIPGNTYRLSFWGATGPDDDSLRLGWIDGTDTWVPNAGTPASAMELDGIPEGTNVWTELSGVITPTQSSITIYADWRHEWASGIGAAWVDDWQIQLVSPVAHWTTY